MKNRVHLDLVRPVDGLLGAGATVLREPSPGWEWHVLADPEGNELCVFGTEPRDWATALVVDSGDPVRGAAWWADVLGATLVAWSGRCTAVAARRARAALRRVEVRRECRSPRR